MNIINKFSDNLVLDYQRTQSSQPLKEKLAYFFKKYYNIILDAKIIKYLWLDFHYDNRFSPALLQSYPWEIKKLNSIINFSKINNILDVGANLWQFCVTLSCYYPHLQIDSFEPNPPIFNLLKLNTKNKSNIRINNVWLWNENKEIDFYYTEWKSAQWSTYKNNSSLWVIWWWNTIIEKIKVIKLSKENINTYDLNNKYDLIKIDVEWYEKEVLLWLNEVDWKYLYMEVSCGRDWSMGQSEIISILNAQWKEVTVIYDWSDDSDWVVYDIVLENTNYN